MGRDAVDGSRVAGGVEGRALIRRVASHEARRPSYDVIAEAKGVRINFRARRLKRRIISVIYQ